MRVSLPARRLLVTTLIAINTGLAGCSPSTPSEASPPLSASGTNVPATPAATPSATPKASPTIAPSPTAPDLTTRPFTVLVLGLDADGRADAISVWGIDPVTRTVAIASIPRDTIDVPLPDGGTFHDKINAFYNVARGDPGRYPDGPGRAMASLVGGMLGIRVDYVAATTFGGFTRLVDAMGGVGINLPSAIVDPHYQITQTQIGIRFPAGEQVLSGQRALIYVRTRYADNDFERQRRQQAFLIAAGRELAADPSLLTALLEARRNLETDFPLDQVAPLLASVGSLDAWTFKGAVLGPSKYESAGSCTCGYALVPKLDEMRKLARAFFAWAVLP